MSVGLVDEAVPRSGVRSVTVNIASSDYRGKNKNSMKASLALISFRKWVLQRKRHLGRTSASEQSRMTVVHSRQYSL